MCDSMSCKLCGDDAVDGGLCDVCIEGLERDAEEAQQAGYNELYRELVGMLDY